ncbi:glycosyltransferase [Halobellus clavatus]|uniref:Glycosyltransferase, catalytic subunit of cellulose synthase and poly-beta-1,6-N-acetylglucosamine synthase n=1 Tax=Halobellus clavatus TaxID=660517 RepID=A0A1H3GHX0_9EURY|nr:glycosyltransferase family 2 protein [Halobellus clavatus]SDY02605.1 Glycosyltransferase, catalytic subunit of cellulose synthase and poly-beta-1,6-N-acetylglucosamine synthase [Halobellus clavatus]
MLGPIAQSAIALVFWVTLVLYGVSSLWWLLEVTVLAYGWRADDETEIGLDSIQVRILTYNSPSTVQVTVNSVPEQIAETKVIAEAEMDIDGATVHVVPDDFESEAQKKGRAIEWARQHLDCAQEYVLYLDEDSIMVNFEGLPAADLIQISEHPLRTGSWFVYLCEVFRVGYQREQRAFHRMAYPLYAWGGAVAVRHELENQVTWDVPTITEDTTFIWRAAEYVDRQGGRFEYRLLNRRFRNQAPPSLREMFNQRRRWMSGTIRDMHRLPRRYLPLQFTRILTWTLSPVIPLLSVLAFLYPTFLPQHTLYQITSIALFSMLFVYMIAGMVEYRTYPEKWPVYLVLTPVVVALHAVGALWGVIRPARDFKITEKTPGRVDMETLYDLNPDLEEEAVTPNGNSDSTTTSGDG